MVEFGIINYWDVYREIKVFYFKGIEGFSFRI